MTPPPVFALPTRRPGNLRRFLGSFAATAQVAELVVVADDDDPATCEVLAGTLPPRVRAEILPRTCTSAKVNHVAVPAAAAGHPAGFFGDDVVFGTAADPAASKGWDAAMLGALAAIGGTGMVYLNDLNGREKVVACNWLVSADLIAALGWLDHPAMGHYGVDNVLSEVMSEAGCLAYLPGVLAAHLHPLFGTAPDDGLYAETMTRYWAADIDALERWESDPGGKTRDLDIVRAVLATKREPAGSGT